MKKSHSPFLRLLFILVSGSIIFNSSCSKEEANDTAAGGTAIVSGRVVTPSGKEVPAATILSGNYSTKSDASGEFTLALASGSSNLTIQTGEGRVFKTVLALNLSPGQHLILTNTQTELKQVKSLAYIPGIYDKIETLIIDSLGYSATAITVGDLSNLSSFSNFGGLFLNCGLLSGVNDMDSIKYLNLMNYAVNFGSIYASDFAVECFTGDNHLRLASTNMTPHTHDAGYAGKTATACISPLLGGFIPDSALCTQKLGQAGYYYNAVILDPSLITTVGNDSLNIDYDLGGFEIVQNFDAPFTPYITHYILGVLALKADLNTGSSTGGLYFTSFHNNPQGVSNEVEAILNYIILNL
jgi:hypothetical protein